MSGSERPGGSDRRPSAGGREPAAVYETISGKARELLEQAALSMLALAEADHRAGRRKDAERCALAAAATFERLGSADRARHAQTVLDRIRERPGPTNRAAALTEREAEILKLAGDGLGNAQIAEVLGISRRTVEKHFEKIHAKLGTARRAQLVAVALSKDFESA